MSAIAAATNVCKEAAFSEGNALQRYIARLEGFAQTLSSHSPPSVPPLQRKLAAAYLLAVQLNEDNGRAALPAWEEHQLRPAVLWMLEALRTAALHGGVSAAAVTRIEAFTRGAARVYDGDGDDLDALDAESFLKWNLCALSKVLALVTGAASQQTVGAVERAIAKAAALLGETPAAALCEFVWKSVAAAAALQSSPKSHQADAATLRNFVYATLLLQELIDENDRAKLTQCDPYLANSFEVVRHEFQKASAAMLQAGQLRVLGESTISAMTAWKKTYTLLYAKGPKQHATAVLLLKNERILKRMVAMLASTKAFGPVCDALLACAAEISKRQVARPEHTAEGANTEHMQAVAIADIAASIC